ncbi:MAG: hypothetical protein IJ733_15415 [Lachnospiraceae bacterium]|nr:hypothetical protein [Lachnospiraceae bacterium]
MTEKQEGICKQKGSISSMVVVYLVCLSGRRKARSYGNEDGNSRRKAGIRQGKWKADAGKESGSGQQRAVSEQSGSV